MCNLLYVMYLLCVRNVFCVIYALCVMNVFCVNELCVMYVVCVICYVCVRYQSCFSMNKKRKIRVPRETGPRDDEEDEWSAKPSKKKSKLDEICILHSKDVTIFDDVWVAADRTKSERHAKFWIGIFIWQSGRY